MMKREKNRNNSSVIDRRWILIYEMKLGLIFIVNLVLYLIIVYELLDSPFRMDYADTRHLLSHTKDIIWLTSLATFFVQGIAAGFFLTFLGLYTSHVIAGPMYRIGVVLRSMLKGDLSMTVRFRKGDRIQPVAEAANRVIGCMADQVYHVDRASEILERLSGTLDGGKVSGEDIRALLSDAVDMLDQALESGEKEYRSR